MGIMRSLFLTSLLSSVLVIASSHDVKESGQNWKDSYNIRSRRSQHDIMTGTSLETNAISIEAENPRQSQIVSVGTSVGLFSPNVLRDEEQMKRNKENAKNANLTAIVHIGPEKTGSSTLQMVLNEFLLPSIEQDGYVRIDNGLTRNAKNFGACFRKISSRIHCDYSDLMNPMQIATEQKKNILITAESLASPVLYIDEMKKYLDQFWSNTIIVVYYRRFFSWIVSLHNEINKQFDHTDTILPVFLNQANVKKRFSGNYIAGAIHRFKQVYKEDVIVVRNLQALQENLLADFYCYTVPNAVQTCATVQDRTRNDKVRHTNEGVALVYNDLAYYAVKLGLVSPDTELETLKHLAWERQELELLLHDKDFDEFSIVCPLDEDYESLLRLSLEAEEEFAPEFYEEKGREEVLAQFDHYMHARKFCHVDAKLLLEQGDTNNWREYFHSLNL